MRLRIPELFEARALTAYGFAKASDGRVSLSTAFRLVRLRGELKSFDAALLESLCDVLDVTPCDLLERTTKKRKRTSRT